MPTPTFLGLPESKQERILAAAAKEFAQRNPDQANIANIEAGSREQVSSAAKPSSRTPIASSQRPRSTR